MHKIETGDHMQTALLDSFPHCNAMILKKHTREIVASNKFAQGKGARMEQPGYPPANSYLAYFWISWRPISPRG